jgi:hypothetical protein
MIPLVAAVYDLLRLEFRMLAFVSTFIGIAGMVVAAICQILQIANVLTLAQVTQITLTAGGAIGLWLLVANILAWRGALMPKGLTWAGLLAGACYILLVVGFWGNGPQNPAIYIGSLGIVVGYPVWVIWFGMYWQRAIAQGTGVER